MTSTMTTATSSPPRSTLSDLTAFLYNNDAPLAVRVIEVKRDVDRVDAKVYEAKI